MRILFPWWSSSTSWTPTKCEKTQLPSSTTSSPHSHSHSHSHSQTLTKRRLPPHQL
ncbi:hypothetical protein Fmac_029815 [Flemingia macrophylla]|uniref:Uncharacterized protein n=1 Tax=Flemingia macrophylla TaxID=520843 RepID=A0ABD1LBE6_9FABA